MRDFVYQYRIGRPGQSIDLNRMKRLQNDYDRVLDALLGFYRSYAETAGSSAKKRTYIARIIARVVAGKMKILLSFPYGKDARDRLIFFDRKLKKCYPEIYAANKNRAVRLLRISRYHLYPAAFVLLWMKNRRR